MKIKRVRAKELADKSGYSAGHITTLTKLGVLRRVRGLYDLKKSLAAIHAREQTRLSDGGHPIREIAKLRAENIQLKNSLLRVDLLKANREMPTGGMRPVKELLAAFSLLLLGVRLQLSVYGHHIGNDSLISGCLPILANPQDQWLHDLIRDDVWSWIQDSDEVIAADLKLYLEVTRKKSHPAPVAVVPAPATGNQSGTKQENTHHDSY